MEYTCNIIYTFDKEGYNKETIENFKLLKEQYVFDNYKDAAILIHSDNIHNRLNSKNVQINRKNFLMAFLL